MSILTTNTTTSARARRAPVATFSPANDSTASLEYPGGGYASGTYFVSWLEEHPDFPLGELKAAEAEARAEAERLDAARRRVERQTRDEAADEERALANLGTLPEPGADDKRRAAVAVATSEHVTAGRRHRDALRAYLDAWIAAEDELHALAVKVAVESHSAAVSAFESLAPALEAREASYAYLGYPSDTAYGLPADRPGETTRAALYWAKRPPEAVIYGDGSPDLSRALSTISTIARVFPIDEVAALADGVEL